MQVQLDRYQTDSLLRQHAQALDVQFVAVHRQFVYTLQVKGVSYRACVLVRSSDYYEKRLNLFTSSPLTMVVCSEHDSCLPIEVLALDTGTQYGPKSPPQWYTPDRHFTHRGSRVLLGQLLCGVQAAYDLVDTLSRSTQYRYFVKVRTYLQQRQGRPLAI